MKLQTLKVRQIELTAFGLIHTLRTTIQKELYVPYTNAYYLKL